MMGRHSTCARTGSMGLGDQGFAGTLGRMWDPRGGKQTEYGIQRSDKVLPQPDCTNSPGQTSEAQQAGTMWKAFLTVHSVYQR